MADTDKLVKVGQLDAVADAVIEVISDTNGRLTRLVNNDEVVTVYSPEWTQGRALYNGGILTETASNAFCHSGFFDSNGKNVIFTPNAGYKIYAWDSHFNEFGNVVRTLTPSGWAEGPINYTYNANYNYVIVCVMKDGSASITPEEAQSAVTIQLAEKSPFALKADFNSLKTNFDTLKASFDPLQVDFNSLKTNYESKSALIVSDEVSYSVTLTGNSYISANNGRIATTQSDYSASTSVEVEAGMVVYLPRVAVSDAVALVAKEIPSREPYYEPLVSGAINSERYYLVQEHCRIAFSGPTNYLSTIKLFKSNIGDVKSKAEDNANSLLMAPIASKGQIIYNGDTKVSTGHIVNAVAYDDGVIIACRSDGKVVRIGYDGTEETLLSLTGTNMDWRLCWMDSNKNVYVSPHASHGNMRVEDRGLYKLSAPSLQLAGLQLSAWETGAFKNYTVGTAFSINTGASMFRYAYADVTPGERVRGKVYATTSQTNRYGIFTDANNQKVGVVFYPSADQTAGLYTFDDVIVPDTATRLYIMTYIGTGWEDSGIYHYGMVASREMTKVISLYNPQSSVTTEAQNNNDTIWTMCENSKGYLFAGVYAHTIRANPAIYRSVDGGNTWAYIINFNTAGLTTNGMHIHAIVYSKWQKAVYCIVGEVNTIFKSDENGGNWKDLKVELTVKGSAMLSTESGIFIGSDGARHCDIDILFNDDITHRKVFRGFANTIFAIRRSDITGFLYAFTKVDSSVNAKNSDGYYYLYPPNTVFTASDPWTVINEWKTHISEGQYNNWYEYYQSIADTFPDDAIRPRHSAILVSRDGGKNWEVLKAFELGVNPDTGDTSIDGFWTTGHFANGECLTGRKQNRVMTNPIVISEGKHKYVANGCNLDGEIFVRTNSTPIVKQI